MSIVSFVRRNGSAILVLSLLLNIGLVFMLSIQDSEKEVVDTSEYKKHEDVLRSRISSQEMQLQHQLDTIQNQQTMLSDKEKQIKGIKEEVEKSKGDSSEGLEKLEFDLEKEKRRSAALAEQVNNLQETNSIVLDEKEDVLKQLQKAREDMKDVIRREFDHEKNSNSNDSKKSSPTKAPTKDQTEPSLIDKIKDNIRKNIENRDDDDEEGTGRNVGENDDDDGDPQPNIHHHNEDKKHNKNGGGGGGGDDDQGGDGDDGDDDDDGVNANVRYSQSASNSPFRNLINQRTPRVLVGIITGGKKESVKTNRQAVLDTWFDEDCYFVTLEEVNTDRVIRLSVQAESGGHRGLPIKVKNMFEYIYEHYIDDYDFFVKADDDTFINMDRLRKSLSVFNPEIPVYLGKPFSSKTRGVAGPNAMWDDFTTVAFCHGGSGYVLSRELLRLVGPYIVDTPMITSLEDCATAAALYQYTAVRCINMNSKMFGGLDLVGNDHDQDSIKRRIRVYEKNDPRILVKTATVHSVKAEMTHYLWDLFTDLGKDQNRIQEVDRLAEIDLNDRRWLLSTSWNCSIPIPFHMKDVEERKAVIKKGSNFVASREYPHHDAICMQSSLLSTHHNPLKHTNEYDSLIKEDVAFYSTCGGVDSSLDDPHLKDKVFAFAKDEHDQDEAQTPPEAKKKGTPGSTDGTSAKRNAVLVAVDVVDDNAIASFKLLVASLRSTGSTADVVAFAPSVEKLQSSLSSYCGVRLVEYDVMKVMDQYAATSGSKPDTTLIFYSVFIAFLNAHEGDYKEVALAKVDSFFQRNPFSSVFVRDGLALFMAYPVVQLKSMSCFSGTLRINEMPALLTLDFVMGEVESVRNFLSLTSVIPYRARRCPLDYVVLLNTYRKEYTQYNPVIVYNPWDGPVVTLSDLEDPFFSREKSGINKGRVLFLNTHGDVATVVTNYNNLLSFNEDSLDAENQFAPVLSLIAPENRKSSLSIVLELLPEKLHDTVKTLNTYHDPTAEEWSFDSKQFLKWQALRGKASVSAHDAFKPVWELMAQFMPLYKSDPTKPKVTSIASPSTHRTGHDILSSLYLRFASRHHKRIFHRGEWPFLDTPVYMDPDKEWKYEYDLCFSEISPKGMWRGDVEKVLSFYDYILGTNKYKLTTMIEDPSQHYLSWMYYFILPKKRKEKPLDVLDLFLKKRVNKNLHAQEFGIRSEASMKQFLDNVFSQFDLVLVKDRLDECLVLLRRMFNWDLLDITYLRIKESGIRFDKKHVPRAPKVTTLDEAVQKKIKALQPLDYMFFERANARLDELISQQGSDFKQEVIAFRKIQSSLNNVCKANMEHGFCKWYLLQDHDFYHMIADSGHSKAIPMY
eukprot:m.5023 g.5023  ORF g.5023 m.5023 type:complete len:1351 (-) comp4099_c0_seq2:162-4214(-)